MRKYLKVIPITLLLLLLLTSVTFAEDADDRIKGQNERIEQIFQETYKAPDHDGTHFTDIGTGEKTKLTQENVFAFFIRLSLNTRRFSIIIFALLMIFYATMLSTVGARSVKKRRKYTFLTVNMTMLFLLLINLPIIILTYNATKESITVDTVINSLYGFLGILQSNSFVIAAVMFITAIDKKVLNVSDIPDRAQGNFLMVGSVAMVLILNLLPRFLTYIV